MKPSLRQKSRKAILLVLTGALVCSFMYVSFAFGFRAGIMEDTVYVLPQC
jgi:hypothetical protein